MNTFIPVADQSLAPSRLAIRTMRRYAPHQTHVQTWFAPARTPTPTQRALSSLRSAITHLFASSPSPSPLPSLSQDTSHSSTDDVHADARLESLRTWLKLNPPLEPPARKALAMLMRPDANVQPQSAHPRICRVCSEPISQLHHIQMHEPTSPDSSSSSFSAHLLWNMLSLALFWILYLVFALLRYLYRLRSRRRCFQALRSKRAYLQHLMLTATCYSQWYHAADALDYLDGHQEWKLSSQPTGALDGLCVSCHQQWNTPRRTNMRLSYTKQSLRSVEAVCDVNMIASKLRELSALYKKADVRGLAFALRASLIRNLAGLCHPHLHAHSRVATHHIVEDYVNVVTYLVAYIANSNYPQGLQSPPPSPVSSPEGHAEGSSSSIEAALEEVFSNPVQYSTSSKPLEQQPDDDREKYLSIEDKLTFLNEARHAHGRTALMLSGGAAMGLNHLGVVKALLDQDLLPKVVCGTSAGALVASIVGIFNDSQLVHILSTDKLINPVTNQPFSFRYFDDNITIWRGIRRLLKNGFIQDVNMLQECLRENYGDLTFEEAYNKTKRILNITVCPVRSSSDPPLLLNYLTAPHVVVWSAATASCALPLVFAPVELVAKSAGGRLVPYHPDGVRWIDGSISSDIPLSRIGELFNVNHFVVSQTNPHVIPRSMPILQTRLALLIKSELQFRYWQALQMGFVPKLLTSIFPHFMQPYAGDVTIMPDVRISDLTKLLKNPTADSVMGFVRRGEIQSFPFLDRIRLHCLIEKTLDKSVEYVATMTHGGDQIQASSLKKGSTFVGRAPSWLWLDTRSIVPPNEALSTGNGFTRRVRDGNSAPSEELNIPNTIHEEPYVSDGDIPEPNERKHPH